MFNIKHIQDFLLDCVNKEHGAALMNLIEII